MPKTKTRKPSIPVKLPDPLPPLLTRPQIVAVTQLSYVSIWKRIKNSTFPAAINVAPVTDTSGRHRRNRWVTSEILAWVAQQAADPTRRQPCAGKDVKQPQRAGGAS